MEVIPLIKMKDRKTADKKIVLSYDILKEFDENQIIYILDHDGIKKNKPNLCTFQKVSKNHYIWVDTGPRNIGDVVDAFMAGATAITIREELFKKLDVASIREITENSIYLNIDFEKPQYTHGFDGFTIFKEKEEIESSIDHVNLVKKLTLKNKIYSYETNPLNLSYWKKYNAAGLLVDVHKYQEFKQNAL